MEHAVVAKPAQQLQLVIADPSTLKQDLQLAVSAQMPANTADTALAQAADQYVRQLLSIGTQNFEAQAQGRGAIEQMGLALQRQTAHRSRMLQEPLHNLSQRSQDGGEVANALVDLRLKVEELDPVRFDFTPGWLTRLLGWLPGLGTPLKRYFTQYESAQTVIDAIMQSLENGREQLKRDNITLGDDQVAMRDLSLKLEKTINLAQLIDRKLESTLESEIPQDDPRYKFVQEELRFPLLQRIQDLQQQLAVNQQGVLALEIIIRNNRELIRGVHRAIDVTVNALQVAVTVALALAHQRIVLDKISALNTTTANLISNTSRMLRTQGVAVHQQASQTQLDMEALKSAFGDISAAMDDISRFRQEALPQMAQNILELDRLTAGAEHTIQRLEEGNLAAPVITIEVE